VRHAHRHALVPETSFVYFIFFVCLYFVSLILALCARPVHATKKAKHTKNKNTK
jgi:hypothetical protein